MNLFEERTYRTQFNTKRFMNFEVKYHETDLWIGIDPESFSDEMNDVAYRKAEELRKKLDAYIQNEPFFKKSLKPFQPAENAPAEAIEMAGASQKAGIGPMASVAGLFAREIGEKLIESFPIKELVVENGGDIYVFMQEEFTFSVFAGESILSERIGLEIPPDSGKLGICTSAGTVGPSLSYGKADAVVVVSKDILLADAYATAFGNRVKSPDHVERVIQQAENFPDIIAVLIICDDKIGIWGDLEMRILK